MISTMSVLGLIYHPLVALGFLFFFAFSVLFFMNNLLPYFVCMTNKGNDASMLSFRKKKVS